MSAATKRALDEALEAHFADEVPGGLLSGYVMQACGIGADDELNCYLRATGEGTHPALAVGLATYLVAATTELMLPDEIGDGWDDDGG